MTDAPRPELYPRYCWHLAPTHNKWCPLRASEIHALDQHPSVAETDLYFWRNIPIRWVRVVGIVVAIDDFYRRRVYTLDDSSGACIEAVVEVPAASKPTDTNRTTGQALAAGNTSWTLGQARAAGRKAGMMPAPSVYPDVDVGTVVDIKGSLNLYREERQIHVQSEGRMTPVRTTAAEVVLWEKRARFRREALDKPWALSPREVRRCRREDEEADAGGARDGRRRRHLKPMAQGGGGASRTGRHGEEGGGDDVAKAQGVGDKEGGRATTRRARRGSTEQLREMIRSGALEVSGQYSALGL